MHRALRPTHARTASRVRTIVHRRGLLHIETPLGVVNVRAGLCDAEGRRVDSIELIPKAYAGAPAVFIDGFRNNRFVENDEGEDHASPHHRP